jgi:hypothetical protein
MNLRSLLNRFILRFKVCNSEEDDDSDTQGQTLTSYNSKCRNARNIKLEKQAETEI